MLVTERIREVTQFCALRYCHSTETIFLVKIRGDPNYGALGTEIHVEPRLIVFGTPHYEVILCGLAESTKPFICLFLHIILSCGRSNHLIKVQLTALFMICEEL